METIDSTNSRSDNCRARNLPIRERFLEKLNNSDSGDEIIEVNINVIDGGEPVLLHVGKFDANRLKEIQERIKYYERMFEGKGWL